MSTETNPENMDGTVQVSEAMRLDAMALGEAAATVSAAVMFVLGVLGAIGVYVGAVEMMEQWHLFFEPTVVGTVAGMIEAVVIGFVVMYAFAWLYNAFAL